MSEHLSPQNLERYRQSALPPLELLAVDDHLAVCEQCRLRLADEAAANTAWRTLSARLHPGVEPIEHLSYEQLSAVVDGQLGSAERQRAEHHLESCQMCAAELQDLRAFSLEVAAFPPPESSPASAPMRNDITSWKVSAMPISQ